MVGPISKPLSESAVVSSESEGWYGLLLTGNKL